MLQETGRDFSPSLYRDIYDDTPPQRIDGERWKAICDRLIDELAKGGKCLNDFTPDGVELGRLKIWLQSSDSFAHWGRRVGEKTVSEEIADAMEAHFAEIDRAGIDYRLRCPVKVETTVTRKLIEGAEAARSLCEWVDFCAAPGLGKTEAMNEYIARMRKTEGFYCPVWSISLDESCISLKAVLALIARQVLEIRGGDEKSEFTMAQAIIEATKGSRGLLFVDEGPHLADVNKKMGIPIINGLRRLVDDGCFGIVSLGNGEIYRRLSTGTGRDKGAFTQLLSRMRDFRVEVGPYRPGQSAKTEALTKADVLAVAKAWGVVGVEESAWCLEKAQRPGALRGMTNIFRRAMQRFDSLDIISLRQAEVL